MEIGWAVTTPAERSRMKARLVSRFLVVAFAFQCILQIHIHEFDTRLHENTHPARTVQCGTDDAGYHIEQAYVSSGGIFPDL